MSGCAPLNNDLARHGTLNSGPATHGFQCSSPVPIDLESLWNVGIEAKVGFAGAPAGFRSGIFQSDSNSTGICKCLSRLVKMVKTCTDSKIPADFGGGGTLEHLVRKTSVLRMQRFPNANLPQPANPSRPAFHNMKKCTSPNPPLPLSLLELRIYLSILLIYKAFLCSGPIPVRY